MAEGVTPPTIREALLAMGYNEAEPQKWLKPVGYQLFTFDEKQLRWSNWFLAKTGERMCWNCEDIKPVEKWGDYLLQLKDFETHTRINVGGGNWLSHFELRAIDL
jgi:hypothetical protein